MKNNKKHVLQKGISVTETMIVMPIIMLLGLATLEMGYVWQAKSALDYAAFMAARAGALSNLNVVEMRCAALKAMFATRIQKNTTADQQCALEKQTVPVPNQNLIVYVANPTYEAFQDFGLRNGTSCSGQVPTNCEIPNANLSYRSTAVAAASSVNIQDANLVRVQLVYGYDPLTPFARNVLLSGTVECLIFNIGCDTGGQGAVTQSLIRGTFLHPFVNRATEDKRLPLVGYGTVRAESPLRASSTMLDETNLNRYGQILSRCQVINLMSRNGSVGGIPPDRATARSNCSYVVPLSFP